jgi:hypothetical protein
MSGAPTGRGCFVCGNPGHRPGGLSPYMLFTMHIFFRSASFVNFETSAWVLSGGCLTRASGASLSQATSRRHGPKPNQPPSRPLFPSCLFSSFPAFLPRQETETATSAPTAAVALTSSVSPWTVFGPVRSPARVVKAQCSKLEPLSERWLWPRARIYKAECEHDPVSGRQYLSTP